MNCPTCLSVMKCISAINPVPGQPGRERMDLHCYNRKSARDPNDCRARCHMGVITEDPKEWVCHEYSFVFKNKNETLYLSGHDKLVDPHLQHRKYGEAKTVITDVIGKELIRTDFIPISTNNDMHVHARNVFNRLVNLVIFS